MAQFNRQYFNTLTQRRRPTNEREWLDFTRSLADTIGDAVQHFNSDGRATSQKALPMSTTGNVESIQNILPLSAEDLGASAGCQINIAAHTCQHGGLTVTYGAGTLTADDASAALAYSTATEKYYYVYVDNPDYSDLTTPTYKATDDEQTVTANIGRYRVGTVMMPTDGGSDTYGGGGGGGGSTGDGTVGNPGQVLP